MELTREHMIMLALGVGALVVLLIVFWRKRARKPAEILDPRERLRFALGKTRGGLVDAIRRTLSAKIDEDVISSLEEILLETDLGVSATEQLLEDLKEGFRKGEVKSQDQVVELFLHLQQQGIHPNSVLKFLTPVCIFIIVLQPRLVCISLMECMDLSWLNPKKV